MYVCTETKPKTKATPQERKKERKRRTHICITTTHFLTRRTIPKYIPGALSCVQGITISVRKNEVLVGVLVLVSRLGKGGGVGVEGGRED
jgi:hypothetical protein